jgi:hypothetical protein
MGNIGPAAGTACVQRATIVALGEFSGATVRVDEHDSTLECDILVTGAHSTLLLAPGDRVLVCVEPSETRAVIMGRIGPSCGTPAPEEAPATILLEATQSLTLRVGDGSITIREDGKILIKGKDLVSHAQRMNRIKGGAVSIN